MADQQSAFMGLWGWRQGREVSSFPLQPTVALGREVIQICLV